MCHWFHRTLFSQINQTVVSVTGSTGRFGFWHVLCFPCLCVHVFTWGQLSCLIDRRETSLVMDRRTCQSSLDFHADPEVNRPWTPWASEPHICKIRGEYPSHSIANWNHSQPVFCASCFWSTSRESGEIYREQFPWHRAKPVNYLWLIFIVGECTPLSLALKRITCRSRFSNDGSFNVTPFLYVYGYTTFTCFLIIRYSKSNKGQPRDKGSHSKGNSV